MYFMLFKLIGFRLIHLQFTLRLALFICDLSLNFHSPLSSRNLNLTNVSLHDFQILSSEIPPPFNQIIWNQSLRNTSHTCLLFIPPHSPRCLPRFFTYTVLPEGEASIIIIWNHYLKWKYKWTSNNNLFNLILQALILLWERGRRIYKE